MPSERPSLKARLDALENHGGFWAFTILLVALPAVAAAVAVPLWFDELVTAHLVALPRFGDILTALSEAADVQPLLSYALVRASTTVFGDSALALRLPSVLAFGAACALVFGFTSRLAGPAAAACATAFLGLTEAFNLAHEARPYSLWLAFSALAVWSWSEVARDGGRRRGLWLLGIGLGGGLACHYYAVLTFFPIAAGEAVRTWRRRRLDLAVWGVMVGASLVLAVHFPLIHAARSAYSGGYFRNTELIDVLVSYLFLFAPAAVVAVVAVVMWMLLTRPQARQEPARLLPEEAAALVTLAGLPVIAVTLALTVTKAYTFRYSEPCVIGVAVLFALVARRAAGDRKHVLTATALLFCTAFAAVRVVTVTGAAVEVDSLRTVARNEPELPIVVTGPILYLQQRWYSDAQAADRVTYLADPQWALREVGSDSADLTLTRLRAWADVSVEDYGSFMADHPRFLVYHKPDDAFEWLRARLASEGRRLTPIPTPGPDQLLLCCEN